MIEMGPASRLLHGVFNPLYRGPGRDAPNPCGSRMVYPDGSTVRLDGVVLGGWIGGEETEGEECGLDALQVQAEFVRAEFERRVQAKLDAATGEVLWLYRPQLNSMDGCVLQQDRDRDRFCFYIRAYFFAPGVEPTLVEGGEIEFVHAPDATALEALRQKVLRDADEQLFSALGQTRAVLGFDPAIPGTERTAVRWMTRAALRQEYPIRPEEAFIAKPGDPDLYAVSLAWEERFKADPAGMLEGCGGAFHSAYLRSRIAAHHTARAAARREAALPVEGEADLSDLVCADAIEFVRAPGT